MGRTRSFPGSLLGFIFASYVVVLALPMIVSGVFGSLFINDAMQNNLNRTSFAVLRIAAAETARYVAVPRTIIDALALEADRTLVPQTEDFFELAHSFQDSTLGIVAIVVLNEHLRVIESIPARHAEIGTDYSRRSFLSDFRPNKVTLSRPFIDSASGKVYAAIIKGAGNKLVVAFLDLDALSGFLAPLRYSERDGFAILDERGAFIAHTNRRYVQERQVEPSFDKLSSAPEGKFVRSEIDGIPYYCALAAIPGTPWQAAYYRDIKTATAVMSRFQIQYVSMIASLIASSLAFASLVRTSIAKRFSALLSRIHAIENGVRAADSDAAGESWREFRNIGEAFSAMAEKVAQREEELRKSEEKYRTLFVRNTAAALIVDGETGRIVDVNPAAEELYGYGRAELAARRIQDLAVEKSESALDELRATENKKLGHLHSRHQIGSGDVRDVEIYSSPVEWEGKRRLYSIVFDVTERKIAEGQIVRALAEKEVLLKEIHHRVKNNLQIMASLISLQAGYAVDGKDVELFGESQDRIISMAAIHELLYERDNLSEIDLADYLSVLADNLSEIILRSNAVLERRMTSITVNPDIALPIGLIANELLTNAAKYAFPGGDERKPGRIEMSLSERTGAMELRIADNGVGLPEDFDPENTPTLGMSLVRNLTLQIGGTVRYGRGEGLAVTVVIPLAQNPGR
jgi:PAS domain S-box-containing protein